MTTPQPDHPSVRRTRALALETSLRLMIEEGAGAVTHQRVAREAGLGRATMYRHWATPEDLLFDTLAQVATRFEPAGTGPLRDELVTELVRNVADLNEPFLKVAFTTIIARAVQDPAAAELRDRLVGNLANGIRLSVEAATARGELRGGLDADRLVAQVMGPLIYRRFIEDRTVSKGFVTKVVDDALAPWLAESADLVR